MAATRLACESSRGGYAEFLQELLATESGIRLDMHDWYVSHFDDKVMRYPNVVRPGRPVRDVFTGAVTYSKVTVCQYFARLGVLELFDRQDPACLREMQYASTNALGFVGYQFGEAILMGAGYYLPALADVAREGRQERLPSFYLGGVSDHHWIGGRTSALVVSDSGATVLATDVNAWAGTFTGKGGVNCLNDLGQAPQQEIVIAELMQRSHDLINVRLTEMRTRGRPAKLSQADLTVSGLLAAAHLCGVHGVMAFLDAGATAEDEFGTSIVQYLSRFSGYDVPFAAFDH